jgi:hypothetical protein
MEPESGIASSALGRGEQMPHHVEERGSSDGVDQTEDSDARARETSGGEPLFPQFAAADIHGTDATAFEQMKMFQERVEKGPYTLFADHDEWELAQWPIKTMNQHVIDEFLKLPIVS